MSTITVDSSLCKRDGICVDVCPARFLAAGDDGVPHEVEGGHCIDCGHCVAVCKPQALTHSRLSAEQMVPMPAELPTPAAMDGLLKSRRSIRAFRQQPVDRVVLEELLDVARRAPTAVNSQQLHWIVVNGREQVHAVAAEIVEGMRDAAVNPAILQQWDGGYDFALRGAPTLVVSCAPKDYFWAKEDCATALAYLELAAEARGLGATWAGYLTRCSNRWQPLRELLRLPEDMAVFGGLMLGRPRYTYHRIPPRKPLSVQWN